MGADVDFYENKFFPEDEGTSKPGLARSIRRLFLPNRKQRYIDNLIATISDKHYDYLFCVGGFSITPALLQHVKANNPAARTIIYFWDSFSVWNYSSLCNLFDKAFSFDPVDCQQHTDLHYLPLFYTSEYDKADSDPQEQDLDFLYIGSVGIASADRCQILGALSDYAEKNGYSKFLWLYFAPNDSGVLKRTINLGKRLLLPHYRDFIRNIESTELHYDFIKRTTLSREKVADLAKRAKCIIDIPVPGQAGMTIRTIEMLAKGKKIITTNQWIQQEKIYDPEYIQVIDKSFHEIREGFINSKPKHQMDVSDLHISRWITTFFSKA